MYLWEIGWCTRLASTAVFILTSGRECECLCVRVVSGSMLTAWGWTRATYLTATCVNCASLGRLTYAVPSAYRFRRENVSWVSVTGYSYSQSLHHQHHHHRRALGCSVAISTKCLQHRHLTEPANICIGRMRISCAKSVGCGCGFVARSQLQAILATAIQLSYLKLNSFKRISSEQLK